MTLKPAFLKVTIVESYLVCPGFCILWENLATLPWLAKTKHNLVYDLHKEASQQRLVSGCIDVKLKMKKWDKVMPITVMRPAGPRHSTTRQSQAVPWRCLSWRNKYTLQNTKDRKKLSKISSCSTIQNNSPKTDHMEASCMSAHVFGLRLSRWHRQDSWLHGQGLWRYWKLDTRLSRSILCWKYWACLPKRWSELSERISSVCWLW